ncbi:MAG: hypothetical protein UT02_C0040G0002 [Parcubacteria group bacterium GW2011_GWC2_38_7]|nr:MAG: hypothetical protein UT02_C0040G0002 [Parcubacteria group bacterium GW2011_GWC2_38_7]
MICVLVDRERSIKSVVGSNYMNSPREVKRDKTKEQKEDDFKKQIKLLRESAKRYDAGNIEESLNLSNVLRKLLHDEGCCISLLGQLEKKKDGICSISLPFNTNQYKDFVKLACIPVLIDVQSTRYEPILDIKKVARHIVVQKQIGFDEYWNEIIISVKSNVFSRREMVLYMAEQGGGCHCDPSIGEKYARLIYDMDAGVKVFYGEEGKLKKNYKECDSATTRNVENACIRHIAHEVLKTFDLDYKIEVIKIESVLTIIPFNIQKRQGQLISSGVGRNSLCPCGSGKNYKKCCLE